MKNTSRQSAVQTESAGSARLFMGKHIPLLLLSVLWLAGGAAFAADQGVELGAQDDLTVFGTGGTVPDPDVEIKGFSIFGSTNVLTYISTAAGNTVFNGAVQVSSNIYVTGRSTFTAPLQIWNPAGFSGNLLYISTGADNIIRMTGAGEIYANKYYGDGSGLTRASPVGSALTSAQLWVGSASNLAAAVAMSGDVTINNTGVTAIGALKVTNAMLEGSIADSKLSNISTALKVSNSATTAASANTLNAIVARDGSGNFTAGSVYTNNWFRSTGSTGWYSEDFTVGWQPATGVINVYGTARIGNVQDPINNLDAVNKQWVLANAGRVLYMGQSAASTGAMGGPGGANAKCNTAFTGSHICKQSEVIASGITGVAAVGWIVPDLMIDQPNVGYQMCGVTRCSTSSPNYNLCFQYTNYAATYYGLGLQTDLRLVETSCDTSRGLHCCK